MFDETLEKVAYERFHGLERISARDTKSLADLRVFVQSQPEAALSQIRSLAVDICNASLRDVEAVRFILGAMKRSEAFEHLILNLHTSGDKSPLRSTDFHDVVFPKLVNFTSSTLPHKSLGKFLLSQPALERLDLPLCGPHVAKCPLLLLKKESLLHATCPPSCASLIALKNQLHTLKAVTLGPLTIPNPLEVSLKGIQRGMGSLRVLDLEYSVGDLGFLFRTLFRAAPFLVRLVLRERVYSDSVSNPTPPSPLLHPSTCRVHLLNFMSLQSFAVHSVDPAFGTKECFQMERIKVEGYAGHGRNEPHPSLRSVRLWYGDDVLSCWELTGESWTRTAVGKGSDERFLC